MEPEHPERSLSSSPERQTKLNKFEQHQSSQQIEQKIKKQEVDDFFMDKSEQKNGELRMKMGAMLQRNRKREQNRGNFNYSLHKGPMFKQTYSYFQDQAQPQETIKEDQEVQRQQKQQKQSQTIDDHPQNNKQQLNQNVNENMIQNNQLANQHHFQNEIPILDYKNIYKKCLQTAYKYHQILKISHYICILRLLMVAFVYYYSDFLIVSVSQNRHNSTASITTPSTSSQSKTQNKLFEPWNIMIYFLSGCVDLINVIGFVSSIRFLKAQIKVLERKDKLQEKRIQNLRIQYRISRGEHQAIQNVQNVQNVQVQEVEQNRNNQQFREYPVRFAALLMGPSTRNIRIGKQTVYMSLYSTLRQFKYKNRDQSAAFKISKIMHIMASFLFFGRMALIQQQIAQHNQNNDMFLPAQQIVLWLFLFLAYLASFELDYYYVQSSTGPYVKIQSFHLGKIVQIYQKFQSWRNNYNKIVTISLVLFILSILSYIVIVMGQIFSSVFIINLILIASTIVLRKQNRKIIKKSKDYINQRINNNLSQFSNSQNISQQYNLHKLEKHQNLSPFGILHKHSQSSQYYFNSFHRIILFLFGLSLLRQSNFSYISLNPILWGVQFIAFFVSLFAELWKINTGSNAKINLLNSFKYSQISQNNKNNKIIQMSNNSSKNTQNQLKLTKSKNLAQISHCSVCLNQYQTDCEVIVLCCGHMFHEKCLLDWLKQKKQCPLCRLNIEDYYEQISN